jgi:PAS domain S-box-containing protein
MYGGSGPMQDADSYMNSLMAGGDFTAYDMNMSMGDGSDMQPQQNSLSPTQQQQQQNQQHQQHQQQQDQHGHQHQHQQDQQEEQEQHQQEQRQQQSHQQDDAMDDVDGMGQGAEERIQGTTVIGAGPLPTSYGMQLGSSAGSQLSEFTKRRNWSQRVVEEIKDFLHILSPDGRILYASHSARQLTGHDDSSLTGQLIFEYLHPDDAGIFVREFNEAISTGNALRFFYRFRRPDNTYAIFESHGHPHLTSEPGTFNPSITPPSSLCRGFFMMARPYPTKNAYLLDSFLEHKMENERLKRRIADLKHEEHEELLEARRTHSTTPNHQANPGVLGPTNGAPVPSLHHSNSLESNNTASMMSDTGPRTHSQPFNPAMPPPAKPTISNHPLTQQNLSEALAASRPDSINDKMARYEGVTHLESIEMLTGLLYRDGERANGISTGAASPTLIRGDAGVDIAVDKDGRPTMPGVGGKPAHGGSGDGGDKKKKMKVAEEFVCTDCGTLDSPEWRKGPSGPKTLCNACGLRWAKKEKRRTGVSISGTSGGGTMGSAAGTGGTGGTTPTQWQGQGKEGYTYADGS